MGTVRRRPGRPDPRLPDATGQARRHAGRRIQILKAEEAAPGNQPAKPTKNPSTDGRDSRQVRRHNAEDARLRIRRRRRQRHALSHLDLDPTKLIASNRLLPKIRRQPPGCRLEEDGQSEHCWADYRMLSQTDSAGLTCVRFSVRTFQPEGTAVARHHGNQLVYVASRNYAAPLRWNTERSAYRGCPRC